MAIARFPSGSARRCRRSAPASRPASGAAGCSGRGRTRTARSGRTASGSRHAPAPSPAARPAGASRRGRGGTRRQGVSQRRNHGKLLRIFQIVVGARGASGRREARVTSTIEVEKAERVRGAQSLADRNADAAEGALLRRFIAELYRHVPPSDVASRSQEDLYRAALALWRFAETRPPGLAKVRAYN